MKRIAVLLFMFTSHAMAAAFVNVPVLNIYAKRSRVSMLGSQAIYGERLRVIRFDHAWTLVQTKDHYRGWIYGKVLAWKKNDGGKAARVMTVHRMNNLYRSPDTAASSPLQVLPFGVSMPVIYHSHRHQGRWLEVRLVTGEKGWIQQGDIRADNKPLTLAAMLNLSWQFLGVPYTWGGKSSFGYDCSGFIQQLFGLMDIQLPRHSSAQAHWKGFISVRRNRLKAGDLLFFGVGQKISHVGLYLGRINNHRMFIDATVSDNYGRNAPLVQLSDLDSPFWSRLFIEARRLKQGR
ncbi:NlpC/P60 family protein [Dongshaea marina]|uniref:NlpC/P60 family protein n=1 Tax=Dongshaea marina TaxID=2047966 RepID=UPI00131EEC4C|nr:NlpC/P60 family protein [Dongshaea marina]